MSSLTRKAYGKRRRNATRRSQRGGNHRHRYVRVNPRSLGGLCICSCGAWKYGC